MNQLKRYLKGEIHYIDPAILGTLEQYESIKVDSIVYDTKEVIQKIEEQQCPNCKAYKAKIQSLKYQLKLLNAPEVLPIKLMSTMKVQRDESTLVDSYSPRQIRTYGGSVYRSLRIQIKYGNI